MTKGTIAEIVSFRALAGIGPEAMQKHAAGIADWLAHQPGFIARTLSLAEDGTWTDHVLWASPAQAMAAGEALMAEPSARAFMEAIDPASVRMSHAPVALRQCA